MAPQGENIYQPYSNNLLLRFLMLPLLPQRTSIKPTRLSLPNNSPSLLRHRHIYHHPIQRPRTTARRGRLLIRNHNPNCPMYFCVLGPKYPIYSGRLRGMDTLLPVEPQLLSTPAFLLQRCWGRSVRAAFVRCTDQVNRGGEVRGPRGGGD